MQKNFTLNDLVEFVQSEKEIINELLPQSTEVEKQPSDAVVKRIFAYNQALSVRKSENLGTFTMLLN